MIYIDYPANSADDQLVDNQFSIVQLLGTLVSEYTRLKQMQPQQQPEQMTAIHDDTRWLSETLQYAIQLMRSGTDAVNRNKVLIF